MNSKRASSATRERRRSGRRSTTGAAPKGAPFTPPTKSLAAAPSVGLEPAELDALLKFALVELPRLRAPLGEREKELVHHVYLLIDGLKDNEEPAPKELGTDGVPDHETLQSLLSAARRLAAAASSDGETRLDSAGAPSPPRHESRAGETDPAPLMGRLDALGRTSPIAAAEQLEQERRALRKQLDRPLPYRVEPFDVVYSGLHHSRDRLDEDSSPSSRAKLLAAQQRTRGVRRPASAAAGAANRSSQLHARSRHAPTGAVPDEAGGATLFESYEMYLAVLRAEQLRLKDERRRAESATRPPAENWWTLRTPRFTAEMHHARRYEQPTPFDWWREPGDMPGRAPGMHLVPAVAFHPAARGNAPYVLRHLEHRQPAVPRRHAGHAAHEPGGDGYGDDGVSAIEQDAAFDALTDASPAWTPAGAVRPGRLGLGLEGEAEQDHLRSTRAADLF
mmetsp:Transcript_18953/g.48859  ORF Transcript_18953/g.48859 Transcript_18953/m.48859 type:complete len:450 (+) Transcript_18953:41-1390(+)